jgi:hypothetical protein
VAIQPFVMRERSEASVFVLHCITNKSGLPRLLTQTRNDGERGETQMLRRLSMTMGATPQHDNGGASPLNDNLSIMPKIFKNYFTLK